MGFIFLYQEMDFYIKKVDFFISRKYRINSKTAPNLFFDIKKSAWATFKKKIISRIRFFTSIIRSFNIKDKIF